MIVDTLLFVQLSAACAPGDASDTLASIARTESSFDTLAIHDNATGSTYHPGTLAAAESLASDLSGQRHSVDLGLMQINSSNLARLGLSIPTAFDACQSLQAASEVLREDYRKALGTALSLYNTGDPTKGITNGYVARVEAAHIGLPSVASIAPTSVGVPMTPSGVAVRDMLHNDLMPTKPSDKVIDLFSTQITE